MGAEAPPTGCFWSYSKFRGWLSVGRTSPRSDPQQAECEFSQEPEAPPTPSALPALLSASLLLLILPGILPGTRPSDVLPLVQVDLFHLLQRKRKEKKKKNLPFSPLYLISSSNVHIPSPCQLIFESLSSFSDMMRCEKASCGRMLQHLESC